MIPDGHQLVSPRAAKSPYCSGGITLDASSDMSDAEADTSAGSISEIDSDVGTAVGISSVWAICSDGVPVETTVSSGVAGDVVVLAWEEGSRMFAASESVGFDHQ